MVELIVTLPTFDSDEATKRVWAWISDSFPDQNSICYYKHPVLMTQTGITPELTLISQSQEPIVIRCLPYQIDDIEEATEERWSIDGVQADSPVLELDDFVVILKSKFDRDRVLRNRLDPKKVIALPLISKEEFEDKFDWPYIKTIPVFADGNVSHISIPLQPKLNEDEWRHSRSIIQGASPLRQASRTIPSQAQTLGEAIRFIDRHIALLDEEQTKAALQIAPGPQRIRGLAGTGKTVLLAMKAANTHLRYPEKKILFTFNTQSLYNQTRSLISRFYRSNSELDPDWDMLHVRHAWGSSSKPGVYSDICARLGRRPLSLYEARRINRRFPLKACCEEVLREDISQQYDFIMVDEAQDFPKEFFQLIYRLSKPPHQIYWVYDELQNLFAEEMPGPEQLFGVDEENRPLVTLEGDAYPGGIEKDLVLHKSYRCPQSILMLAHAIGLGLYSPDGCIQMLTSESSWEALGYELEQGELNEGSDVVIIRPPENSPNPIQEIYQGDQELIISKTFQTRSEELEWIAESIKNDVEKEGVPPDQIIAICLDARRMREHLPPLQSHLIELGIPSTLPGLVDDSAAFGEPGKVTLSTVFRAKGNESNIVYIFSFDSIFDYVEALQNRNRAFTAISRAKAWVRITGVGPNMEKAKDEIDRILADQPRFKFRYTEDFIRSLDAETYKRKMELTRARESIAGLVGVDARAIEALAESEPELFNEVVKRIKKVESREDK